MSVLNPFVPPSGPDLAHWPPDRVVYALRRPDADAGGRGEGWLCEVAFETAEDALSSRYAHPLANPSPIVVAMTVVEYLAAHVREIETDSRSERAARIDGLDEYANVYDIDWRAVAGSGVAA